MKYYRTKFYELFFGRISDAVFIKWQYRLMFKRKLSINPPLHYNEKIQYMKLYYRTDLMQKVVNKIEVRDYVKEKIGDHLLIDQYGIYDSIDDVDFDNLPDQFVVKLNSGSNMNYICRKKTAKAIREIKYAFRKWIKVDYYYLGREWAYKGMVNKIIIERYMEDAIGDLNDVKFFCYNGQPKFIQVDIDRYSHHKRYNFDTNWQALDLDLGHSSKEPIRIGKPKDLDLMLDYAKILAKDFLHVRVDFYYVDGVIYFGELTFYQGGGYRPVLPEKYGRILGDWMDLSKENLEKYSKVE